jgi:hypothetical protein
MAMPENKDFDAVERVSKKLYSPSTKGKSFVRPGILKEKGYGVKNDWSHEEEVSVPAEEEKKPSTMFKKIFLGALLFFIFSVSYAAYTFFAGDNVVSSKNVDIEIAGPAFVGGGEELALQVVVRNKNSASLELADLLIEYPKGAGVGDSQDSERGRDTLGEIKAGGVVEKIERIKLFGEEGSDKEVKFTLEYRIAGSNAVFTKEANYVVRISTAPVSLSVDAPKEGGDNQDFQFKIRVSSNSENGVGNLLLRVEYPTGFEYKSAEPKPTFGNNVWRIGDLGKGGYKDISIQGILHGQDGEDRTFRVYVGEQDSRDEQVIGVVYNSAFQSVSIKRAFISARLLINGKSGDVVSVSPRNEVQGEINWKNNLPTKITNARIEVVFSGSSLDPSTITTDRGFYNSLDNTISWDKNSLGELREIQPGDDGRMSFSFYPRASSGDYSSREIVFSVNVYGESFNATTGGGQTVSSQSKTVVRVNSDFQVSARALYYSGPFSNEGQLPPQVGKETTYTITFTAVNSTNRISRATVKTILPSYIRFAGIISPESERLTFNDKTGEVTWDVGAVEPGVGFTKPVKEVSFKIGFRPSLGQVGKSAALTGDITYVGSDEFTGNSLSGSSLGLTTTLNSDQSFNKGDDIIVR